MARELITCPFDSTEGKVDKFELCAKKTAWPRRIITGQNGRLFQPA